jgi:hypothetical protein
MSHLNYQWRYSPESSLGLPYGFHDRFFYDVGYQPHVRRKF